MKISGRNIKRRLYGLRHLTSNLKRVRYFRGHGVHSPFVYNIVRQVFMCRELKGVEDDLYNALIERGVPKKRSIQLQNLLTHCNYAKWCIDPSPVEVEPYDFIIASIDTTPAELFALAEATCKVGITLCILSPTLDKERHSTCQKIVKSHHCTSVDNRGYLLLFNNHLPKQEFRL